jgi:outer membrane protein assembly factor BamD
MRSLAVYRRFIPLVLALALSACGLLPEQVDETVGWSANKIYSEAKSAQSDGAYDKAIKYFEKLESRYPYGRYAQQAQLEIAYSYYKQNEVASAIAACDRFIRLQPNHPNVDYAYYMKGLVNFNEDLGILGYISNQDLTERDPKAARDSFDAFRDLITRYPNSKYAPDARDRMNYLINAMASYEVHVANYYMRRSAYVAAVNRAQYSIKSFPDAPANEAALAIMVKSYDALGMTDLRDDSERIMRKNFPDSRYFTQGRDKNFVAKETPWWQLW